MMPICSAHQTPLPSCRLCCAIPEAFTIGNYKSYDRTLAEYQADPSLPTPAKLGRQDDYEGGWVWATQEEAQAFIDSHDLAFPAKVYGLLLPHGWSFDVSTQPHPEDGVHRLLNTSYLIQLGR